MADENHEYPYAPVVSDLSLNWLLTRIYPYAPMVFGISTIWLLIRIIKYGFSYCFKVGYASSVASEPAKTRPVQPYPMKSGAMNAAIGGVDKCCEFVAYCEDYVIPTGICSPEPLEGYIDASPQSIAFGFTWKSFYYSLDSKIEEKRGYSITGDGFMFSENSGMVSYSRAIPNDDPEFAKAYAFMFDTPVDKIISEFERVAENNFEYSKGRSHNASCRCTVDKDTMRSFEFTV